MRPLFATIDTAALKHNLGVVRRRAPRSRVLAVIKANAYGHGLMRAAAALSGADGFALLELEEAVRLREAGFGQRIVLLEGFFDPDELPVLLRHQLGTVVHSMDQVAALEGLPDGAKLDVVLKVNTGMNRLGIAPSRYPQALERLQRNPGVGSITLATHFADADDARGVGWQLERLQRLPGFGSLPCSLANSAAILRAGLPIATRLQREQLGVHAVLLHQVLVRAAFDDVPLVEHDDLVGVDHRRQPMGDDEGRAALGDAVERGLDLSFGERVERRRRLVKHEDRRRLEDRAGDRHALLLAARQL